MAGYFFFNPSLTVTSSSRIRRLEKERLRLSVFYIVERIEVIFSGENHKNMLSIIHKGIDPSAPQSDAFTYLTALNHAQSIVNDNGDVVEKIQQLLAAPKTRLLGLYLLQFSLEQNPDIYLKGNWTYVLYEILKESGNYDLKEKACQMFSTLLPFMVKDSAPNVYELRRFSKDTFPFLLRQIEENVEWSKGALQCVLTCLKLFPQSLTEHRELLLTVIFKQMSYCVSSYTFEIVAECYAEMPSVVESLNPTSYQAEWKKQYLTILENLRRWLNSFASLLPTEPFTNAVKFDGAGVLVFGDEEEDSDDIYRASLKLARRYMNVTKCVAKMLSSKSRHAVEIPIKSTLMYISWVFQVQDLRNIKPASVELQIFCSVLSQMQLATLTVLESLILNFDVLPYSGVIADLMQSALASSKLTNVFTEIVSEIRHAVWKILKTFIKKYGNKVSGDLIGLYDTIIRELLSDISVEGKKSSKASQASPKSKKTAASNSKRKCVNKYQHHVCRDALETLEQLVYTGSAYFSKDEFQETFTKVLQIACSLYTLQGTYPFPYDDESCRKNLYSVILGVAVASNLEQRELTQYAVGVLKNGFRDPSTEVSGVCNIAMSVLSAKIQPKRPPPKCTFPSEQQRATKVSSAMVKCPEWSSDEFVPNLPLEEESKAHENMNPRITRTFHETSEGAMLQDEQMDDEMEAESHYSEHYASEHYAQKYPEQGAENHIVEDMLEIQNSSECQDDVDSEDEEEEEEEERSYGEEDINQGDDVPQENMYIPSTSKLQVVNPVHITPETIPSNVADREYEQLKPCVKTEDSTVDSNKNMHLNGSVHSIVPDADVPSSSTQPSLANENGVFVYEEEDLEDEEGDEEEEEEATFPAEKRVPGFYSANQPPSKKPKLDNDESKNEQPQEDESPRSPTLSEMKADFCCSEIDDVKS